MLISIATFYFLVDNKIPIMIMFDTIIALFSYNEH